MSSSRAHRCHNIQERTWPPGKQHPSEYAVPHSLLTLCLSASPSVCVCASVPHPVSLTLSHSAYPCEWPCVHKVRVLARRLTLPASTRVPLQGTRQSDTSRHLQHHSHPTGTHLKRSQSTGSDVGNCSVSTGGLRHRKTQGDRVTQGDRMRDPMSQRVAERDTTRHRNTQ